MSTLAERQVEQDRKIALAVSPDTAPDVLATLACDANVAWVRWAVAENPATPTSALTAQAVWGEANDDCALLRRVAEHPATAPETLAHLAELIAPQWLMPGLEFRWAVASHPNTPTATLEEWANRPGDAAGQRRAARNLANRGAVASPTAR